MDFLGDGLRRALGLLFAGDPETYGVALLTFKVAAVATVIACAAGIPAGFLLASRPFWGRRAALTVVNTALAFPTVLVGLLLYGLLSRRGPLGGLSMLYTWQAIALGDVLPAFPIAAAPAPAAAITAAFGHVIAEIGSAMIVGGNVRGQTRTLTTAIALSTSQGDFGLALALGIILLVLALLVNVALQVLQGRGDA